MTDGSPIACSLSHGDLQLRLDEIAKLGAEGLIAHQIEGNRHVLRFRKGAETRQRLEAIVASEAQCCSFLDLALTQDGDELVLSIVAPIGAEHVAIQLANAF
jgi:hypothetical protein